MEICIAYRGNVIGWISADGEIFARNACRLKVGLSLTVPHKLCTRSNMSILSYSIAHLTLSLQHLKVGLKGHPLIIDGDLLKKVALNNFIAWVVQGSVRVETSFVLGFEDGI